MESVQGEGSGYSPQVLQTSWYIWGTRNILPYAMEEGKCTDYNWGRQVWVSTAGGARQGGCIIEQTHPGIQGLQGDK